MDNNAYLNEWESLKQPAKKKLRAYFVAHHTIDGLYKLSPAFLLVFFVQYSLHYESFQWMQSYFANTVEYVNLFVQQFVKIAWEFIVY